MVEGVVRALSEDEALGPAVRFEPWRDVGKLPERAPIRRLRPDEFPKPPQVRARLAQEGIDPDNAGPILSAILRRGWTA
jgi:hypothetical protein